MYIRRQRSNSIDLGHLQNSRHIYDTESISEVDPTVIRETVSDIIDNAGLDSRCLRFVLGRNTSNKLKMVIVGLFVLIIQFISNIVTEAVKGC